MSQQTTNGAPAAATWVRCPSCGQRALYAPQNPYRPFCTATCKQIDLGSWASEEFRVSDAQCDADDAPAQPNTP